MLTFESVSVIIPAVAEKEIRDVVMTVISTCSAEDLESFDIVIGEKSDADYVRFLEALQAEASPVPIRILRQPGRGLGDAVHFGIMNATGSHTVILGADMENDPADIAYMVSRAKERPDTVITASRRLKKGCFSDYPRLKRFLNDLFCLGLKILFRSRQTDITYAYQIAPTAVLQSLHFAPEASYNNLMLDIGLLPELTGSPFEEFPSVVGRRKSGKSNVSLKYYVRLIGGVLRLFFRNIKRRGAS